MTSAVFSASITTADKVIVQKDGLQWVCQFVPGFGYKCGACHRGNLVTGRGTCLVCGAKLVLWRVAGKWHRPLVKRKRR